MNAIAILPEVTGPAVTGFRAVAGSVQSVGRTPGEALDALTPQLPAAERDTLVVVQHLRPDKFFTAEQQARLAELWRRWRAARDANSPWSADDQEELDRLVEAEIQATGERAAELIRRLTP